MRFLIILICSGLVFLKVEAEVLVDRPAYPTHSVDVTFNPDAVTEIGGKFLGLGGTLTTGQYKNYALCIKHVGQRNYECYAKDYVTSVCPNKTLCSFEVTLSNRRPASVSVFKINKLAKGASSFGNDLLGGYCPTEACRKSAVSKSDRVERGWQWLGSAIVYPRDISRADYLALEEDTKELVYQHSNLSKQSQTRGELSSIMPKWAHKDCETQSCALDKVLIKISKY